MSKAPERVVSFSMKPGDKKAAADVERLKDHSKATGISFSFLMLQAIAKLNEELGLK